MSWYLRVGYSDLLKAIENEGGQVPCAQFPDAFFPEMGRKVVDAKRLCQSCPIRLQCLDYALGADEEYGIWGGLDPKERGQIKNAYRKQR